MDISREPSERELPLLGERSQVASAPSTPRVALLDNAKGALIYCVVLYHVAVVYTGADRPETPVRYASGFLMVLKPVVMPGFCLISGHLSRASLTPKHVRGLYQALATYALFQLLYFGNNAWSYWYNGFEMPLLPLQLFQPPQAAVTWFLAAWVLWKATLPALMQTRWPLPLACGVGLFSLFLDLGLNYQNLLSFWPYFVAGHLLPADAWERLSARPLRWQLAALFLGLTALLALFSAFGGDLFAKVFLASCINYGCFTGVLPNTSEGCGNVAQLCLRALFYAASIPLLFGFLCCLPRTQGVWTVPGFMSMYVYLLHPLVISNPLVMRHAFDFLTQAYGRKTNVWSPATDPSAVAIMPVAALVVTALLSLPWPTRWLFRHFVEPKLAWLFTDPPALKPAELRLSQSTWAPPELAPAQREEPTDESRARAALRDRDRRQVYHASLGTAGIVIE